MPRVSSRSRFTPRATSEPSAGVVATSAPSAADGLVIAQMTAVMTWLSFALDDVADILGVPRATAYGHLVGEMETAVPAAIILRLAALHLVTREWVALAGVPMGRLWAVDIRDGLPSLRTQLLAPSWDHAHLRETLVVLAEFHQAAAQRAGSARA